MRTIGQLLEALHAPRAVYVEVYKMRERRSGPGAGGEAEPGSAGTRYGAVCGPVQMTIGWEEFLELRNAGALQVSAPVPAQDR